MLNTLTTAMMNREASEMERHVEVMEVRQAESAALLEREALENQRHTEVMSSRRDESIAEQKRYDELMMLRKAEMDICIAELEVQKEDKAALQKQASIEAQIKLVVAMDDKVELAKLLTKIQE
jgi:hypothetical protein